MADKKVSELTTALSSTIASGDKFLFLDVSDTSQGPNGTVKTVTRAQLDGIWDQRYQTCTSLTRPLGVFPGHMIFETDTNKLLVFNGDAWWTVAIAGNDATAISPTGVSRISQNSVGIDIVNGVGEYTIINGVCEMWWEVTINSTGTAGHSVRVNLPVSAVEHQSRHCGAGMIFDASVPHVYTGSWELLSSTQIGLHTTGTWNNLWGATPSVALASGDRIRGHIRYRVANAA
jgi:hypothetical protein